MSSTYRVVKLLKNHLYPTYQLHAFMANSKTKPQDGLRLAALTTMHWLKARLGDDVPSEWRALPAPEEYQSVTDDALPSLYVNQGHVVNVVSLPDNGTWTLQITEPDLGSDPGNPLQARTAIPGRIIETNIAFQIVGNDLECRFKTVISDPVGTEPEAEVYRLAIVKQLMQNPAFGLKQVTNIPMKAVRLANGSQVKTLLYVLQHADNDLPAVVFTQMPEARKSLPAITDLSKLRTQPQLALGLDLKGLGLPMPTPAEKAETLVADPPFDLDRFCYYTFSHCRTYVLEHGAFKAFTAQSGVGFRPGDILVLYPGSLGGGETVISCPSSDADREKAIQTIEHGVKAYSKTHPVSFGKIVFLSEARERMLRLSQELMEDAETTGTRFRQEVEQINAVWKSALAQKDRELEDISSQLQRQKEYTAKVQAEKSALREAFSTERDKLQEQIKAQEETMQFLRRRCDQPSSYEDVAAWVEKHFGARLILHPKAVARLTTKACQSAGVDLICDALDFLATDYWEQRYLQLSKDVALTRCSQKYGRPFEIKPTGQATIDYTPSEYHIPYSKDVGGKERALDYHLRVGNDPGNLLRIYFFHDDENNLIVVGSLPDHLRAVKVQ